MSFIYSCKCIWLSAFIQLFMSADSFRHARERTHAHKHVKVWIMIVSLAQFLARASKCVRDGVVRSESDSAEWWCCRRTFCIFIYQFAGYAHHKHIKSKLFTFMDGGWGAATVGACNLLSRKHFYFYYLKMQRICARSELAEVTHTHTMRSTYTIYAILIIY